MLSIRNKLPMKVLLPILAVSLFAVGSFATSVGVTTQSYAGQGGVNYVVTGAFSPASNGFQVVQSTATASTQPCTWSNGATCATALTAGDWYYQVTLTIAASALASHTYTVTVQWNTGAGYLTLGTLTFTTPATISAGQTMIFQMDTATTTFNAPATLTVTVA
ncbi:MAG TPA: hypothetical protein VLY21_03365 [Nitrososphaerales archaeon]|nr:hypothetical protein [Nitrososphaerales archaeon]